MKPLIVVTADLAQRKDPSTRLPKLLLVFKYSCIACFKEQTPCGLNFQMLKYVWTQPLSFGFLQKNDTVCSERILGLRFEHLLL